MKNLYVIGLGPGDPELVTVKATKALSRSEVIYVPYSTGTNRSLALSVIQPYIKSETKIVTLGFPMAKHVDENKLKEIGEVMCKESGEISSFVTLGDPSLYSTFFRVKDFASCFDNIDIIPGVSSIMACASKLKISLALGDESILISPSSKVDLVKEIKGKVDSIVILKGNENLDLISEILKDDYQLFYARRCYLEGEKVLPWNGEFDKDYFSMLIGVKKGER